MTAKHEYEVAFSFAGEDRNYVEKVAKRLRSASISVFYDKFEEVDLWGKDLYSHLDDIYRNKARHCVIFISQDYKRKQWTNHERESAQARAFEKNQDYILPARFDNTEIPGIRPTQGYIDLQEFTPELFAKLLIEKLRGTDSSRGTNKSITETRASQSRSRTKTIAKDSTSPQPKKAIHAPKAQITARTSTRTPKPQTKTVGFNKSGISELPNDRPVVYKILTEAGTNNFTGAAKKGDVQASILKHLSNEKKYVPGSKVHIERMNRFADAQAKAERIIQRTKPKYN